MTPLNPELYNSLRRVFGKVKIANQGLPFIAHIVKDPRDGKEKIKVTQRGEAYLINCPFCISKVGRPDTKFRLWINHRWNTRFMGRVLTSMAKCYNEDCLTDKNNVELLRLKLFSKKRVQDEIVYSRDVKTELKKAELPDGITPIGELPDNHPAVQYLIERKFDPKFLSERYNISYCEYSTKFPVVYNRIIIPIYQNGELMSWQARYIGDPPEFIRKYYNAPGLSMSRLLYGYDFVPYNAPYIILVEGVTDVWRLKDYCVASFGTHLSEEQIKLLKKKTKKLFILWDSDAIGKALKLEHKLKGIIDASVIELPVGFDPDELLTSYEI